jgi:hypothetical protein
VATRGRGDTWAWRHVGVVTRGRRGGIQRLEEQSERRADGERAGLQVARQGRSRELEWQGRASQVARMCASSEVRHALRQLHALASLASP